MPAHHEVETSSIRLEMGVVQEPRVAPSSSQAGLLRDLVTRVALNSKLGMLKLADQVDLETSSSPGVPVVKGVLSRLEEGRKERGRRRRV